MFTHFEEGNILSETCNNMKSGDESYDDSIMPPLLIEKTIDVVDSGDESDDETMSAYMI